MIRNCWVSVACLLALVAAADIEPTAKKSRVLYDVIIDETREVDGGKYSQLNITSPLAVRVILSPIDGDPDLYASYVSEDVSFDIDKHNASSTSYGVDYLDVRTQSAFEPRPVYVGAYGHPRHARSKFRLLVISMKWAASKAYSTSEDFFEPEWEVPAEDMLNLFHVEEDRSLWSLPDPFLRMSEQTWSVLELLTTVLFEI